MISKKNKLTKIFIYANFDIMLNEAKIYFDQNQQNLIISSAFSRMLSTFTATTTA